MACDSNVDISCFFKIRREILLHILQLLVLFCFYIFTTKLLILNTIANFRQKTSKPIFTSIMLPAT